MQRAAKATTDMLDAIVAAKKAGASEESLKEAAALHRKALNGLLRAAGDSPHPGRDNRFRAPGSARGGAGVQAEMKLSPQRGREQGEGRLKSSLV